MKKVSPPVRAKEQLKDATFVFQGTVQQVGAATMSDLPPNKRMLVVMVDHVEKAPRAFVKYEGQKITVLPAANSRLSRGTKATFYATGWRFGESLAVRELWHST